MKKFFMILLSVTTLFGILGYYLRIVGGDEATNLTNILPWGLWVVSYTFFIGLSEGGYFVSSLWYVFKIERYKDVAPIGLVQAISCLTAAFLLILTDLGHPERGLSMIVHFNSSSVMAWMFIFYQCYVVVIILQLASVFYKKEKFQGILGKIGLAITIVITGGVGSIFATVKSHPIWNTGLMPVIFIVSAVVSGTALLAFLVSIFSSLEKDRGEKVLKSLAKLSAAILCLETLILFAEISVAMYSSIPAHLKSYQLMFFGDYWYVFWIVQLFIGTLVPLILIFNKKWGSSNFWLTMAVLVIVLGAFGTRLNIVIPPLISPAFDNLPQAYLNSRFQAHYFPSVMEWLCLAGAASLSVWTYIAINKFLSVNKQKETSL